MNNRQIGIKENLVNFILLVVTNFFVGSMVGLERALLPLIGKDFGLASASAALSFIISFGFSKAIVNYFAGTLADWLGRKKVLLLGWGIGLLVPLLIIFANSWWVIIIANIFLGINQGLTWSMTVNMKIDIAKSTQRGIAVGLNEFAGYSGVAVMAAVSGFMASTYSNRPEPFYLGLGIVVIGMILSLLVKDSATETEQPEQGRVHKMTAREIFLKTTFTNKNMSSVTFAGFSTNFKDGMAWGLLPIYFTGVGLTLSEVGVLVAIYPSAWGLFQLFTGALSDRIGRKRLIVAGMGLQAFSLWMIIAADQFSLWLLSAILLGLGTAMVYPTLQAAISDVAQPEWRASSMGVYRFWRDSGYAFGALFAGLLTDILNVEWAIGLVALLPLGAAVAAAFRLRETLPALGKGNN
ncbi:MFS transporter [Bhargavaea beijingensis]|uniref:Predicted arabinose efflux permease, MFS family n=1 Tax=Bhargavaea beijingensis TaxID=426756 RepID=A0A1G7E3Z8_9BACL|nr:MFS transporter [Bhargavaea beijingensis]MCW1927489.1 MFS transporter [Bhargavaea beijingensis]SDE58186.1 Predicted arabinose efflux permease, MFS family [Bhargavaea beijingensis]